MLDDMIDDFLGRFVYTCLVLVATGMAAGFGLAAIFYCQQLDKQRPPKPQACGQQHASLAEQPADVLHLIAAAVADRMRPRNLSHLSCTCAAFKMAAASELEALRRTHGCVNRGLPYRFVQRPQGSEQLGSEEYYIARLPVGNYSVYSCNPSSSSTSRIAIANGYGHELTFVLEDGTFKTVSNPRKMARGYSDYNKLVDFLQLPELNIIVSRITIGTLIREPLHPDYLQKLVDVVYEETEFVTGPVLPRIPEKWFGLDLIVEEGGATRVTPISLLRLRGEDEFFNPF